MIKASQGAQWGRIEHLYGIIDTARDERLYPLVMQTREHACLFSGPLEQPLAAAAPYLVKLTPDTPLTDIWRNHGWGRAWGLMFTSTETLDRLRVHFRQFLRAKLPDGRMVLFRFYDPRVWRVYWPTCTNEDKAKWMRGVSKYYAE